MGLGSPEPLEPVEEFVPLCHAVCVTLSEEWVTVQCLFFWGGVKEPPSLGCSRRWVLAWPLAQTRGRRCVRAFLRGITLEPRAILEGSVKGSFGRETLTPGLSIFVCLSLVTNLAYVSRNLGSASLGQFCLSKLSFLQGPSR
jgi:hypothetical protein